MCIITLTMDLHDMEAKVNGYLKCLKNIQQRGQNQFKNTFLRYLHTKLRSDEQYIYSQTDYWDQSWLDVPDISVDLDLINLWSILKIEQY
jgi:hypothetical protein